MSIFFHSSVSSSFFSFYVSDEMSFCFLFVHFYVSLKLFLYSMCPEIHITNVCIYIHNIFTWIAIFDAVASVFALFWCFGLCVCVGFRFSCLEFSIAKNFEQVNRIFNISRENIKLFIIETCV